MPIENPQRIRRIDQGRLQSRRPVHAIIALVVSLVGIIYGSLYPFVFQTPVAGIGAFHTLLDSWDDWPGRGDFLANILLYVPIGLFAMLSCGHHKRQFLWLIGIVFAGAALSTLIELAQYFDEDRVTSAADVYANSLGTAVGAVAGLIVSARLTFLPLDLLRAKPVESLLVTTWAAYRLYPYVPTIDLHKYWTAVKPLVQSPSLTSYDLYRHTAAWLALFTLITATVGERRGKMLTVLFAGACLVGKVMIVDGTLSVAEVIGPLLALGLWQILPAKRRRRATVLVVLFAGYVIAERLEPFVFSSVARPFSWIPFLSFLGGGSLSISVVAFFEKVFLYGSLLYLAVEAGLAPVWSALFIAMGLFVTSWIETYVPGRSAEITDAVMVLLIAAGFSLLRHGWLRDSQVRFANTFSSDAPS